MKRLTKKDLPPKIVALQNEQALHQADLELQNALLRGIAADFAATRTSHGTERDREHYLATILQASPDGFWVVSSTGRLCEVNDAYCAMSGYTREEILGLSINDLDAVESPAETQARIQRVMRNGSDLFETRHRRKDGTIWPVEIACTWLGANGGQFIAFCRDLTERKQREERISLLGQMLDAAPACITIHSLDGRFVFANRATLVAHGYHDEAEFLHLKLDDLDEPETTAQYAERLETVAQRGEARFEVAHRRKDGSTFPLEVLAKSIVWAGEPAILSIATDITERKRLEEQLRQSQKMEAVGQLAGGVAHDFNNLLQVILVNAELLQLEVLGGSATVQDSLEEVKQASQRAADLVRQLLTFSRRQIIQPVFIDLNEAIHGVLKMLRRLIGEHISLHFVPGMRLSNVYADRGQVEQVLLNLCVNARDAMPQGGQLSIKTQNTVLTAEYCKQHKWAAEGEYVLIRVADTGKGMDEETCARIFEPFFTTKGVGEGTGLGLATVYGIVKQHNGLIHVTSLPGTGTIFSVYLPAADPPDEAKSDESPAAIVGGTETILVAEDESAVMKLVAMILHSAGYSVLTAADGNEALRLFEENSDDIHLVLLDVMMPGLGGKRVMDQIKARRHGVKFLFSSGYSKGTIHSNFAVEEGQLLISKPYRRNDLLRAVRQALDADSAT